MATTALDFGTQGGDPARAVSMDLSTCVNRYGPAPAALAALRSIEPGDILLHPTTPPRDSRTSTDGLPASTPTT
jgi:hypothetical protein